MDRIPLPLAPLEARRLTALPVPGYQAFYRAIIDGRIPAERAANGRWTVARDDLPKIVSALCRVPTVIAA